MKLIDKDALVAEIEKRRAEISDACQGYIADKKMAAEYILLNELLDFIDTLEAKEVDLEKPFEGIKIQTSMESGSLDEIILTTKYKAQKGE